MTATQPNIPAIRFPEFSEAWRGIKLGEHSDVRDGTHDTPAYQNLGYKLITSKNLTTYGKIDYSNAFYISVDDFVEIGRRSKVDIGDILFGMIGTIGNPVLVDKDDFAIKNVALIKESGELKNAYLIHYLRSAHILRQFHKQNTGGTQKFIALNVIRNLGIKIPNLEEQQKIATFLSSVDVKSEQLNKKKSLLEQYKQGMMQKLFSQEIRFKDERGKEYPDWEERTFGEISLFKNGKPHEPNVVENGTYNLITLDSISIEGKLKDKHKKVDVNDKSIVENDIVVVLSDIAHARLLGLSSVIESNDKYVLNQRMGCIRAYDDHDPKFLSFIINFNQKYFRRRGQGTSQRHIYERDITSFSPKIPCKKEQHKIAAFLSAIDKKIEFVAEQLKQVQTFKKGLLQQMFI